MAIISGDDAHKRRLERLRAGRIVAPVTAALLKEAVDLQVDAQISITTGAISGAGHIPSLPGEPPNNNTGVLAGNIEAVETGPLKAEVSSSASYAVALEFGTSRMAERPYMRPAAAKSRKRAPRRIREAVNIAVRRSG